METKEPADEPQPLEEDEVKEEDQLADGEIDESEDLAD